VASLKISVRCQEDSSAGNGVHHVIMRTRKQKRPAF